MRTSLLAAALAAVLAGCGGGGGDPDGPGLQQNLPFVEVEVNAFSGVRSLRTVTVNDDAAWAALWAEHTANVSPAPPRPAVDFSTQTVAAVFLGETTDCSRPVVESVVLTTAGRVRVGYRVLLSSGPCPAVVTSPVDMVRFSNVPRHPVEFERLG